MFSQVSKFDLDTRASEAFRSSKASCRGETLWARVERVDGAFPELSVGSLPRDQGDLVSKEFELPSDESLLVRLQSLFRRAA